MYWSGFLMSRLQRGGRALVLTTSFLLAIAACGAPAGAQESESVPRAWLGIGLEEVCQREGDETTWSCARAPVVQSVVIESPADRAGFMPGDTLVSIDGKLLATVVGDKALSALQVGRAVVLELARGSRRITVTVEPAPWPQQRDMVFARTLAASPTVPSRVVSLPRIAIFEDSAAADVEVFVDSVGGRSYAYRFRLPDGSVSELPAPRIDVPLRLRMTRPGTPDDVIWNAYMIAELARMSRGLPDSTKAAEYYEMARRLRERYEAEVVPRLRVTYDSALAQARVRLDSLRVSVRVLAPERSAERLGAVRAYEAALKRAGGRVAGAEFEELNPHLADAIGVTELGITEGLFVVRVVDGTPAAVSGLRSGDVVIEVAGLRVGSVAGLRRVLLEEDEAVEVIWIRKGETRSGHIGGD
jgi:C-terminal processing protease CtpA/Prc